MPGFNGPAGGGDTADFIFTNNETDSVISLPGDKDMTIQAGEDSDLYLTAGDDLYIQTLGEGDDIHINAADDIRFSAGNETETTYFWRMDSEGRIQLPGDGYISNPIDSSGDPSTPYNDTIHLVPDDSIGSDQYVIIDPTAPNHIHIRAGGSIDNSSAQLILGGEKTNVNVSDSGSQVGIVTTGTGIDPETEETYEYQNYWYFGNDGVFYGPGMGSVTVPALVGAGQDYPLGITSADKILLNGDNGEFLNDPEVPANQIATLGDVGVETEYAVSGGTTGTQPTFDGEPLFSASYVRMSSDLVHFQIQVDMDNITSFGTGQYYMTLPFNAKYAYQFREGCLHDIGGEDQFQISGHVAAGSNMMYLFFAQSAAQDEPFTSTAPVTLQTNDNFHISGTYIAQASL